MNKRRLLRSIVQITSISLLVLNLMILPPPPAQAATYGEVVISEIMYDPLGTDFGYQWVELFNPTSQDIDVSGWVITDASSFPDTGAEGKCVIGTATIPAMGFLAVSPNSIPGVATTTLCTMSGTFLIASSDNLALFTEDSANAEMVYGTLGLDANNNPASSLNFPYLSGSGNGRSIGLKDPIAGWSSSYNDWFVETTHTALAANEGWADQLTTPHTITIDGTVDTATEWQVGELLGAADGDPTFTTLSAQAISDTVKYYVTWDADNLYVGFIAPPITTTNRQHYNVVIDTDPYDLDADNDGLTTAAANYCDVSYETNGKADYAFQTNPTDGFTAHQVVAGSWQSWSPASSNATRNTGSTQAEFQIAKSEIGISADTEPIGLYLYVCNDSENVAAAWPPENEINPTGTVTFTTRTIFNTTQDTRSPRDEATHIGYQTHNINAQEYYTYFDAGGYFIDGSRQNWYARLMIQDASWVPTDPSCMVTLKVTGNLQITRLGGGIRRAYDISPVNCPGLTARLSLKYEDGTDFNTVPAADNDVNQTPSETRGLDDNAMVIYHNTGGDTWVVLDNLTRSTAHNRVAHMSGYGTSDFSLFGFGYQNNTPTALELTQFEARPLAVQNTLSWLAAAALLLISSALIGLIIHRWRLTQPPR